jgi:hypothetical protein
MTLVRHTNCGFVLTAPTSDPAETALSCDTIARALKDVSPALAVKITEVGWWCDNATEEANFEVGLYSNDGTNNKPLDRLFVSATNAKGTTAGWKVKTGLDWTITGSTTYWIAVQLDNTATQTDGDGVVSVGDRLSQANAQTTLAATWISGSAETAALWSIYAVGEAGSSSSSSRTNRYKIITDLIANAQERGGNIIQYINNMNTILSDSEISSESIDRQRLEDQIDVTLEIMTNYHENYSSSMKDFVLVLQQYISDNYSSVNNFLLNNNIKVLPVFADISGSIGYPIDAENIENIS